MIDIHVTSDMDMFSKASRFTTKKYIIFQQGEKILYNKRKTNNIKEFNNKEKEKVKEEETDEFNVEEFKKHNEEILRQKQHEKKADKHMMCMQL